MCASKRVRICWLCKEGLIDSVYSVISWFHHFRGMACIFYRVVEISSVFFRKLYINSCALEEGFGFQVDVSTPPHQEHRLYSSILCKRIFSKAYRTVLYNFLNEESATSLQKCCHEEIKIKFRIVPRLFHPIDRCLYWNYMTI